MDLKWCKNATKWSLPDADWTPIEHWDEEDPLSKCTLQHNANDTTGCGQSTGTVGITFHRLKPHFSNFDSLLEIFK